MNIKILLSITTITPNKWKDKIEEIDKIGLKEIALFPTALDKKEREKMYALLEKTKLEKIPHVHLRSDMQIEEIEYLVGRFHVELFNVHPENSDYPPLVDYGKYSKKIYVENMMQVPTEDELEKYAGLCIDISHWEDCGFKQKCEEYKTWPKLLSKYKIGCGHISVIKEKKVVYHDRVLNKNFYCFSDHNLEELRELDYVKKYKNYLADIMSIELENTLEEQLEIKKYLEKLIG